MAIINLIVEGDIDEAIAMRLIEESSHEIGVSYGKKGIEYIRKKIHNFNLTANVIYYLVLVDFMDTKTQCPPEVVEKWLPHRNKKMIFRVVVKEIESWVLADRENLAGFLKVNIEQIPLDTENESDPKQKLVNIARKSRSKTIRDSMVPEVNSTATVGKLYNATIKEFVRDNWDINSALKNSISLRKCLTRLKEISD